MEELEGNEVGFEINYASGRNYYDIYDSEYNKLTSIEAGQRVDDVKGLKEFWTLYKNRFANTKLSEPSVVVVGMGEGHLAHYISEQGHYVYGIEQSRKALDLASSLYQKKSQNGEIELICSDFLNYDHRNRPKVDVIMDQHCLHCLPMHIDDYFSKVIDLLKVGGNIILEVMTPPELPQTTPGLLIDDQFVLWRQVASGNKEALEEQEHYSHEFYFQENRYVPYRRFFSPQLIEEIFESFGLKIQYLVCPPWEFQIPGFDELPSESTPGVLRVIGQKKDD